MRGEESSIFMTGTFYKFGSIVCSRPEHVYTAAVLSRTNRVYAVDFGIGKKKLFLYIIHSLHVKR